jgi:hypothetical protein
MRIRWSLVLPAAALTALAGVAAAHHSFTATYFEDRTTEIEGKLLQFMFRNPHSFVHVEAPDENGQMQRWAVEWGGAGQLAGQGVTTSCRSRAIRAATPRIIGSGCSICGGTPTASSGAGTPARPSTKSVRKLLLSAALLLAAVAPARAQISIVGEWTGRYHEDQSDRVPGDVQGDFSGVPMNDAARKYAEAFDVTRVAMLEHQCQPYNVAHIYRGPIQFRVWEEKNPATQEIIAYRQFSGTYMQFRTIWMDGRPHPPAYVPHTHMGFSTGTWHGDILTVTTTHIKKEFYRRSGIPSSDLTTLVEHYIRHGNLLSHVMIITDPVYLSEPYVLSQEFVLMERGNQNWLYNCEYVMEVPMEKNDVPFYQPGQNPFMQDWAKLFGLPFEAVIGGAPTTYPEYLPTMERLMNR